MSDLIRTEAELAALERERYDWWNATVTRDRLAASLRAAWAERDRKAALLLEMREALVALGTLDAEASDLLARADAELGEDT